MIEMMTAYTEEVDETEDGIGELLGQIDLGALKKNSIGLVTCHHDFIGAGFIEALCEKLPFNIIGMTTLASANRHGVSMYAFSLTVLTSDDVIFESAVTGSLNSDNYQAEIKTAYDAAAAKIPGPPALILSFFPFINEVNGAMLHKSLDEACQDIPFWGSLASNVDGTFKNCFVFHNGGSGLNILAMILIHGDVDPEFVLVSLPRENIGKTRGQITKSDGCILREINGLAVVKYLETLGIIMKEGIPIITPLMVYYPGISEPVALGMYTVNPDGSLLCGGEMTEGAFIAIGEITAEGIIASSHSGINKVMESGKRSCALFLPCISRYLMLAPHQSDELDLIINKMENGNLMPFMIAYSGGELCPVRDEAGILHNRFHNYTFTACVL